MGESIGVIGDEPVAASAARLRTILPGLISDAGALRDEVAKWTERLHEPSPTRLTVRAVLDRGVIPPSSYLEAAVPLAGGRTLVYLGENLASRRVDERESHRLDEIAARANRNHGENGGSNLQKIADRLEGARAAGYAIAVARTDAARAALSAIHSKEVAHLLGRFGYDSDAADAVLAESGNLLATASYEERVVAIVVLERAAIPLSASDAPLRIAELTDSSVEDDHVGSGLQLVLHTHLVAALLKEEATDLIFSESGYTASLFNAASFGRRFCGRLPNHAHIGKDTNATAAPHYQSLEVTALTGEEATALVDSLRGLGVLKS